MKKYLLVLSFLFLQPLILSAQNFEWLKTLGGTDYDYSPNAIVDEVGNVFVIGFFDNNIIFNSQRIEKTGSNSFIAKYSSTGVPLIIIIGEKCTLDQLIKLNDNTIAVVGRHSSNALLGSTEIIKNAGGTYNIFCAKLDANLNVQFIKQFYGSECYNSSISTTNNGHILLQNNFQGGSHIVGLETLHTGSQGYAKYLVEIDNSGNFSNLKFLDQEFGWSISSIKKDVDGNMFVLGSFINEREGGKLIINNITYNTRRNTGSYLVKIDKDFHVKWLKEIYDFGMDNMNLDENGNLYLCGTAGSYYYNNTIDFDNIPIQGASSRAFGLYCKIDNMGNMLWYKKIEVTNNNIGLTKLFNKYNKFFMIGKFNGDVTIGSQNYSINGLNCGLFIKTDEQGNIISSKAIKAVEYLPWVTSQVELFSVDANTKGEIIIAGTVYGKASYELTEIIAQGRADNIIMKFTDFPTDITEFNNIPLNSSLSQNFPNPFNPNTKINFVLPKSSRVLLKVYNLLGQEKVTLINKELSAGNHEVNFDGLALASGIYFYRIQAGEFIQTKKMILLK